MKKALPALILILVAAASFAQKAAQRIDRRALVSRHNVVNKSLDTLASLTVGNGRFAFTVDATGLQTFPEYYQKGVPLGTQSEWGWGQFPNPENYRFEETLTSYHINGRDRSYSVQNNTSPRTQGAVAWYRENPYRLQLGNIGFAMLKADGSEVTVSDIKNIRQELDLWTGGIKSHFTVEGIPVDVLTYGDSKRDCAAAQVTSPLVKLGRLKVKLKFPYPTNQFTDYGTNYKSDAKHKSELHPGLAHSATITNSLPGAFYWLSLDWTGKAKVEPTGAHQFEFVPDQTSETLNFCFRFEQYARKMYMPQVFNKIRKSSEAAWQQYWTSGAVVDFSGSTDKRAFELERRVVLSQYLTRVQCAGNQPPQETGLTYNSWYGRPHLEMHWWHGIHFALWGHPELLAPSLGWYERTKQQGITIAERQGYKGIRWPKMTDPKGGESPSSVGAFLIWQQPHFIYMAELEYRAHPKKETLEKYKDLVFGTAEFMASYAHFNASTQRYVLGPGLIPSQEVHKQDITINPPYELTYWHWALSIAQQWKTRLNQPRDKAWDEVIAKLSPLPQKDGVYLEAESAPDSYTNPKNITDHPSTVAAYGMMPYTNLMDTLTMRRTYELIEKKWNWPRTWGWDFPMMAMTAARLNMPEKAVDALLMNIKTNTYLPNGHNYQDGRLTIYLPGNGGLLAAVAMMCAGWDGNRVANPGIPKNGQWKVKWEGLQKMP